MKAEELIKELGRTLGAALELSPVGTCSAAFDGDVVEFEQVDDTLWIYADLGSSQNREDAALSLLAANRLGLKTGGAAISLDEERDQFVMHMEVWGDVAYESFESRFVLFIKALRWWKEWLSLPPVKRAGATMQDEFIPMDLASMIRV